MTKNLASAAVALALSAPLSGLAADNTNIAELKQQIEQLKHQYNQQIQALEARIQQAETASVAAPAPPSGDNSFNPAISLVLQGGVASYSQDPEDFHLEGMPLGGESGLAESGPSLWETELTASANVDNLFYGKTTLGLHNHEGSIEVDIEEAFVDTLSLPGGLGLRFGRFYSAAGYLNEHHTHAWDFADAPLAYQAFLGKQYRDDGLRATWLAPSDSLLIEVGAEVLRGEVYPGGTKDADFGAMRNLFAHVGGDVGLRHSWQLGLSRLAADGIEREAGGHAHAHEGEGGGPLFAGDTELTLFDAVWKTALGGERAFTLQGEYLLRDENGQVGLSEDAGDALFDYQGEQSGWYLQGVYQFNRQWRTGLRYDRLHADNSLAMVANTTGEDDEEIFEETGYLAGENDPQRWTAMLDWSPSEFSRLRLQYARDESREQPDDQWQLQYIMTLGAHGAHQY